jgi:chromosomal replication initiation ATPase DnaA
MIMIESPQVAQILEQTSQALTDLTGHPVKVYAVKASEVSISETTRRDNLLRKIVSEVTGLNWNVIASKKRDRELVEARQLYCVFAKKFLNISLKEIAKNIARDDHSTVIHSINTIKDLLETDHASIVSKYKVITDRLNQAIYHESKAQS